ncbi:hypothetical protein [Algoriphagus vanfongensis]|uniref:hypothetical protein n=1 Tax=Algoriphagus vanfongensis TaxID=426371 RepID=UPI0012FCE0FB|nr:hypothetical protein [Algoriphagus vanfongensis]
MKAVKGKQLRWKFYLASEKINPDADRGFSYKRYFSLNLATCISGQWSPVSIVSSRQVQ